MRGGEKGGERDLSTAHSTPLTVWLRQRERRRPSLLSTTYCIVVHSTFSLLLFPSYRAATTSSPLVPYARDEEREKRLGVLCCGLYAVLLIPPPPFLSILGGITPTCLPFPPQEKFFCPPSPLSLSSYAFILLFGGRLLIPPRKRRMTGRWGMLSIYITWREGRGRPRLPAGGCARG